MALALGRFSVPSSSLARLELELRQELEVRTLGGQDENKLK